MEVDYVFKLVNENIAKDFQSGYTSNDEFNRHLRLANHIIFQYYVNQYEVIGGVSDKLRVFNTSTLYSGADGYYPLPENYSRQIAATVVKFVTELGVTRRAPQGTLKYVNSESIDAVLVNHVKKKGKYYTIADNKVGFFNSGTFEKKLRYFRTPKQGVRAVTINSEFITEEYDAANSTDLEWDESVLVDFVNILSMMKGIEVGHNRIMEFAKINQLYNSQPQ